MNKILLTGSTGHISSHLFSKLMQSCDVTRIGFSKKDDGIKNYFNLDLTDIDAVNSFCKYCDSFDSLVFLVGLAYSKGKGNE